MNALILDGSLPGDAASAAVREAAVAELESLGWESETLLLSGMRIEYCQGCFGCWTKDPGVCVLPDEGREVTRMVVTSDLVVFVTPVTFGGYSSALKRGVDRMIGNVSPFFTRVNGEVHHRPRYESYPRIVGVGLQREANEEEAAIFRTLVDRNAINAHSPGHAAEVLVGEPAPGDAATCLRGLFRKAGVKR